MVDPVSALCARFVLGVVTGLRYGPCAPRAPRSSPSPYHLPEGPIEDALLVLADRMERREARRSSKS